MDAGRDALAGPDPIGPEASVALWLRTPSFAISTVTLAVGAHVAGGEGAPDLGTVAFITVVTGLLWSSLAAAAEHSLPRLVVGVTVVQLGLHVALLGGHHHGMHTGGTDPSMWAAHAFAMVLLAWWLRRGEVAFWRATRRMLARLVPRGARPAPVMVFGRPLPPAPRGAGRLRAVLVLLAAPRRGPPLAA